MNSGAIAAFKEKLKRDPVLALFMKTGDPAFVEAAGWAGVDAVILDREHGPVTLETMQNNIRAAQLSGVLPIVRVGALDALKISQALDIGAAGVQIPQVSSRAEAENAVRAARFHPAGERGVCRFVRAARYSACPREEYFPSANQVLVILQLEGSEAVENLDEILAVPGVDILFLGPYDLSQSLGVPGEVSHPKVVALMREVCERAQARGVVVGTFTDTVEALCLWRDAGVRYLAHGVDVGLFYDACAGVRRLLSE